MRPIANHRLSNISAGGHTAGGIDGTTYRSWFLRSRAPVLLLVLAAVLVAPKLGGAQTDICERTKQVRDEIVRVTGSAACDVVVGLESVRTLILSNDEITALRTGDFAGLTGLETLWLSRNQLEELSPGVFARLTSLKDIRLGQNQLRELSPGVFAGLTSLEFLDLDDNLLGRLSPGTLAGLTSLDRIWLRNNQLEELSPGVFTGLTRLATLLLSGNRLTELAPGTLAGLTSLEYLGLHDNLLRRLSPGVFAGLTRLKRLSLRDNQLTELPAGLFKDLRDLATLTLIRNPGSGNFRPMANAGVDFSISANVQTTVELDGTSSDGGPWGDNVIYSWSQVPPVIAGVRMEAADTLQPKVFLPSLTENTPVEFKLTVTGRGEGETTGRFTAEDTVVLTAAEGPTSTVSPPGSPIVVREGSGETEVCAVLDRPRDFPFLVTFSTVSGTAVPGEDYVSEINSPVSFRPGATSACGSVTILDDDQPDDRLFEDFHGIFERSPGLSGTAMEDQTVEVDHSRFRIIIVDDDFEMPVLSVSEEIVDETDGQATVTVTLNDRILDMDAVIDLAFDGAATAEEDYTVSGTSVTLTDSERTARVEVTVLPDQVVEHNEDIEITARLHVGDVSMVVGTVTITVRDNDEAGVQVTPTNLTVKEGETESYEVVLLSEPSGEVTIEQTVQPGTDVTLEPATLKFTTTDWQTAQTVFVTASEDGDTVDDPIVELTFQVSGGGYADVGVPGVQVTIDDDDEVTTEEKGVVEETVRTVTASAVANVTTNIGARFSAARGGAPVLTLAGQRVLVRNTTLELAGLPERHSLLHWDDGEGSVGGGRRVSVAELVGHSAFQVVLGAADGGTESGSWSNWTLWGRGDMLFFEEDSVNQRYDGDLVAAYLGLDVWLDERWLMGVAASQTRVKADYALESRGGELRLSTTGLHPYFRYYPNERTELGLILGAGTGGIGNRREGVSARESSDVTLYMGAASGRFALAPGAVGGIDVAFFGDVGFGALDTDSGTGLEAVDNLAVETWRARLGMKGSYTLALKNQKALTPFVEVSGRYDGGGEDEHTGVEISGGLSYADPQSGLGVGARANVLTAYSKSDYREYGASLTASLTPKAGGRGLSLSVTPRLGRQVSGAEALWRDDPFAAAVDGDATEMSLDARVGYGVPVPPLGGMVTPFGEVQLWDGDGQRMRAGVRYGRMASVSNGFSMEIVGERTGTGGEAERRVGLLGRFRF